MKECNYCKEKIYNDAIFCKHCNHYQARWKNWLLHVTAYIALSMFVLTAIGYIVRPLRDLYKNYTWRDKIEVVSFSSVYGVITKNSGDGDVFIDSLSYTKKPDKLKKFFSGGMIIMVTAKNKGFTSYKNKELFSGGTVLTKGEGFTLDEITPVYCSESDGAFRNFKSTLNDKMITFSCEAELNYYSLIKNDNRSVKIPCIGYYLRKESALETDSVTDKKTKTLEKFENAALFDPENPALLFNWGNALDSLGRHEEAIDKFKKAVKLDPDNINALNNWGNALDSLGKYKEAIDKLEQAVKLDPENPAVLTNWGRALSGLRKYEEAIDKFEQAAKLDPVNTNILNNLGNTLSMVGKNKEAIDKFKQALKLDPDNINALNNWGNSLNSLGKYKEAIDKLEQAVKLDPENPAVLNNLGNALYGLGKYNEAREKLEKAVRLTPKYPEALNGWGAALVALGKYEEGIDKFEQAVKLKPGYTSALHNWGIALKKLGRFEEAEQKNKEATGF
jgi:Flp pilus assembly protein TadD